MSQSNIEEALLFHIRATEIPEPVREYRFHPVRKWQADFAWPNHHLLVEVEGGIYKRGRHVRPEGYSKDCEKYNTAQLEGFTVLRFTPDMIHSGLAISTIIEALKINGEQ